MSETRTIPVVEPVGKIRFITRKSLFAHVKKHLLDGREEQWSQLVDADQLAEARREIAEERPDKPMLLKVVRAYYRLVSSSIIRLASEGVQHQHLYWEPVLLSDDGKRRIVSETLPDDANQTVEAWDLENKILIIARAFVRNGEFLPYVLCSAFRPFPKLSGNSLRNNMVRQLRERQTIRRKTLLLAEHDAQ